MDFPPFKKITRPWSLIHQLMYTINCKYIDKHFWRVLQANVAIFPKASGRWHRLIVHQTLVPYIWFTYGVFHNVKFVRKSTRSSSQGKISQKSRLLWYHFEILYRVWVKMRRKLLLPIHFSSVISHLAILHRTQTLHCRGLCNNIHDWSNVCFVRDGFAIFGNKISDGFVIFQSPHDDVIQ